MFPICASVTFVHMRLLLIRVQKRLLLIDHNFFIKKLPNYRGSFFKQYAICVDAEDVCTSLENAETG